MKLSSFRWLHNPPFRVIVISMGDKFKQGSLLSDDRGNTKQPENSLAVVVTEEVDRVSEERSWGEQIADIKEKHPGIEEWFNRVLNEKSFPLSEIPQNILVDLGRLFGLRYSIVEERAGAIIRARIGVPMKESFRLDGELYIASEFHIALMGIAEVIGLEYNRRKEGSEDLVPETLAHELIERLDGVMGWPEELDDEEYLVEEDAKRKQHPPRPEHWNPAWDTDERVGIYIDG